MGQKNDEIIVKNEPAVRAWGLRTKGCLAFRDKEWAPSRSSELRRQFPKQRGIHSLVLAQMSECQMYLEDVGCRCWWRKRWVTTAIRSVQAIWKTLFFLFSFLFFFFAADKGHWTRAWPLNFARERCRRLAANHPVPTCGLIKKNGPNSGKYHKNEETRCVMRKIIQSCKTIYSNKKIIY